MNLDSAVYLAVTGGVKSPFITVLWVVAAVIVLGIIVGTIVRKKR